MQLSSLTMVQIDRAITDLIVTLAMGRNPLHVSPDVRDFLETSPGQVAVATVRFKFPIAKFLVLEL